MVKLATPPILREVIYLSELGLSESDIAAGTGAGRSTVRAWLRGTRAPTGDRSRRLIELTAMAERLEAVIDPDYIAIWLNKPVPALGDGKPIEMIGRGRYRAVAKVISGLEGQLAA